MPWTMTSTPVWIPAIRFTVPGVPVPKGRPRFATNKGGVRTYTDAKTKRYEESVAWHAVAQSRGQLLAEAGVPVRVDILASYPRTKKLASTKAPDGPIPKCTRTHGDLDNHIKAILDGLNRAKIWVDDGQVSVIRAEGVYADKCTRPSSVVSVYLPLGIGTEPNTSNTENEPCNTGGPSRKR